MWLGVFQPNCYVLEYEHTEQTIVSLFFLIIGTWLLTEFVHRDKSDIQWIVRWYCCGVVLDETVGAKRRLFLFWFSDPSALFIFVRVFLFHSGDTVSLVMKWMTFKSINSSVLVNDLIIYLFLIYFEGKDIWIEIQDP